MGITSKNNVLEWDYPGNKAYMEDYLILIITLYNPISHVFILIALKLLW